MNILHTESSNGWGGQEMRILSEAEGMRLKGHTIIFATQRKAALACKAREKGFIVYEVVFQKKLALWTIAKLLYISLKHHIDLINTHSSKDAWIGGIASRLARKKIIRTRHLSNAIRQGLNSRLLYKTLADFVVTTSSCIIQPICQTSRIPSSRIRCIPTGIRQEELSVPREQIDNFRKSLGIHPDDCLVGTVCVVRSWKGIPDFIQAARLLSPQKNIKWVVVGGGHYKDYIPLANHLPVVFTGHLEKPAVAIAAMDIFALLSTANEGISQATLQAAYLQRPLITTPIGGLPEVCIHNETGLIVPPHAPEAVADAIYKLAGDSSLRHLLGSKGKHLVEQRFTLDHTLQEMDRVYQRLLVKTN